MPRNRSNTFWLSYSDLMTSLFFIMLVLFIVCVVKMKGINDQLDKEVNAKEEQLRKIEELNNSIKEIDNKYEIPMIGLNEDGRVYNYYRDLDGVYIKNEVTNMRSGSYDDINDIPEEVNNLVIKGVY